MPTTPRPILAAPSSGPCCSLCLHPVAPFPTRGQTEPFTCRQHCPLAVTVLPVISLLWHADLGSLNAPVCPLRGTFAAPVPSAQDRAPPPAPVNSCTSLPRAVAVALWQCRGCRGHSVKDAVSGREGPCPRTACFWAGKAACWRQAGRMFWRGGHGMSLRACPPVPESAVPASGFPVGGPGTCGPRPTPAGLSAGPTASPTCTSHSSRRRCRAPRSSTAWPT